MAKYNLTDANVEQHSSFFISINDANGTTEVPHFKQNHSNVLIQYFDDVGADINIPILGTKEFKKATAFTIEQAIEMLKFIQNNKARKQCIVHCAARHKPQRSGWHFYKRLFSWQLFRL